MSLEMNDPSSATARTRFDSLVVAIDFTATADRILPIVGRLAGRAGLPVQLVTTASRGLEDHDWADLAARTGHIHGCAVTSMVLEGGNPTHDLAEFTRSHPRALMCIASHGRTAIGELLLGSMTEELVRHHVGPMLAIGPRVTDAYEVGDTLLVAVDAEGLHKSLLDAGSTWQTTFGGNIDLFEAITRPSVDVPLEPTGELQAALELIPNANVSLVDSRDPVRAIGEAAMLSESVIAVAAHARSGLDRLVRGSVTGELLRWVDVPLLMVSI
jgi:nucleotide-binding universal stress UspA family protein